MHKYNFYQCSCGEVKEIRAYNVEKGHTKSCGHLKSVAGHNTWKKNLVYTQGRGGWPKKHKHKTSPIKGKIRIYTPPNQTKIYHYTTYEELENGFWGFS